MESNKNFDSELQAYFGAIKHAIKEEHINYLKSHPELRQILNDFLSSCLLEQPDNVYEYAKKFFSYFNYHKDIVRHKPLVITGCSGVGKVSLDLCRVRSSINCSPKTPTCSN
jgi:guanylate kinase